MSVDNAISMLMIPTMLVNVYLNISCLKIPKLYPEQFARRSIKMPVWLYNACSILGGLCAGNVAVTLFMDLTKTDAAVAAAVVAVPLFFSFLALKKGSVKKETLDANRQQIVDAALKADR